MRQIISIAQHNQKRQEVIDAKKWLAEAENSLLIAEQEFSIAEESEVMDNCSKCKGTGQVEDGYGNLNYNISQTMLYRDCPICEGKGYNEEEEDSY